MDFLGSDRKAPELALEQALCWQSTFSTTKAVLVEAYQTLVKRKSDV